MAIPQAYLQFKDSHPQLVSAYESLGEACREAGPLDARTAALVKLGIAMASGLEGATHSAARKALQAGCEKEEMLHAAVLATTTLGFPAMMRARSWVVDVLEKNSSG